MFNQRKIVRLIFSHFILHAILMFVLNMLKTILFVFKVDKSLCQTINKPYSYNLHNFCLKYRTINSDIRL